MLGAVFLRLVSFLSARISLLRSVSVNVLMQSTLWDTYFRGYGFLWQSLASLGFYGSFAGPVETSLLVYLLFLCVWSAFLSLLEVGFCWAQETIQPCASKQPFCSYKAWSIISSLKHHFGVLTGPRDHSGSTYPDGFNMSCTVRCQSQTSMALLCHLTIGFLPWGHDVCWGHAGERTLVCERFAPAKHVSL